jgi:hypothetical protein
VVIWYIFPVLVCLDQEKSGNPAFWGPSFLPLHVKISCARLAGETLSSCASQPVIIAAQPGLTSLKLNAHLLITLATQ